MNDDVGEQDPSEGSIQGSLNASESGPPASPAFTPSAWEQGASSARAVPGAPGFVFASMIARVAAYVIDGLAVGLISLAGLVVLEVVWAGTSDPKLFVTAAFTLAVSFVYFIQAWTSARRATLGQRVAKIQVGRAFDGRVLTTEQAVSRWFALGFPIQALAVVPLIAGAVSGVLAMWSLALLVATAVSPTRQGFHDRFARSAVVQRAGEGMSGAVLGCIIVISVLVIFALVAIVALIFLGSQIQDILRQVGESI